MRFYRNTIEIRQKKDSCQSMPGMLGAILQPSALLHLRSAVCGHLCECEKGRPGVGGRDGAQQRLTTQLPSTSQISPAGVSGSTVWTMGSELMREANLVYTISTLSTSSDTNSEYSSSAMACASLVVGDCPRSKVSAPPPARTTACTGPNGGGLRPSTQLARLCVRPGTTRGTREGDGESRMNRTVHVAADNPTTVAQSIAS